MSVRAIDAVWRSKIKDEYTLLWMLALADWADDEGKAYPNMTSLADKSRQSLRKAQYCRRAMEKAGVIRVVRGGGRGNPNVYHINFEALKNYDPDAAEKDAPRAPNENGKDAQDAPKNDPKGRTSCTDSDQERVHEKTEKGARVSHTRGEPSGTVNPPPNEDANLDGTPPEKGGGGEIDEHLVGELVRRGITRHNPSAPFDAERLVRDYPRKRIARQIRHFDFLTQLSDRGSPHTGAWLGKAIVNDLAIPPNMNGTPAPSTKTEMVWDEENQQMVRIIHGEPEEVTP